MKTVSKRDKKALKRQKKFAKTCKEVLRKHRNPYQSNCTVKQVLSKLVIHDGLTLLHLTDIVVTSATCKLLENAEIRLKKGHRYGLVGRNGLGKSTFLRHLANGSLQIPPGIDLYLCEQAFNIPLGLTVFQFLSNSNDKIKVLQKRAKRLETNLKSNQDIEHLNEIYADLDALRADESESRARKILNGLGFPPEVQDNRTSKISGGWLQRLSLARALFIQPELLLLDEPTNHLDIDAVLWLQAYLQSWKKTLIIASHYQDFLDKVCTDIIHLDNKKLTPYKGTYSSFHTNHEQRKNAYLKTKKKEKLAPPSKSDLPPKFSESEEILVNIVFKPSRLWERIQNQEMENSTLIRLENACFTYGKKEILSEVNFELRLDTRIVLVGANGVGKTTFLKLLYGGLELTGGTRTQHPEVRLGVLAQLADLPMDATPMEYLVRSGKEEDVRAVLNELAVETHAWWTDMKQLSGGQITKVALAEMILIQPDVLILDEPTNNLDSESINALIEALREFSGAVIMVTHDQRTAEQIGCEVWKVAQRTVHRVEGGFQAYVDSVLSHHRI